MPKTSETFSEKETEEHRKAALNEMPAPLPKLSAPKRKNKLNPRAPATKAEHAALKRVDKMVIKRMRKR